MENIIKSSFMLSPSAFHYATTERKIKRLVNKCKIEILNYIEEGLIPSDVESFSELHDYVDANYYGGFIEEGYKASKNYVIENEVQNRVDEWLKNGRNN